MINRIIEFSAHNRFVVFLFAAAAVLGGWWSIQRIPLDAIPDLSDTQVIVYSRWDRSPDIMEDQVTYPIVSAMLGAPTFSSIKVKWCGVISHVTRALARFPRLTAFSASDVERCATCRPLRRLLRPGLPHNILLPDDPGDHQGARRTDARRPDADARGRPAI